MAKSLALGTVFRVENPATTGYLVVGNLTSIGVPGPEKPEVDVSDFDSEAAEFLPGLPDYGELPLSGNYNGSDAGQDVLFDDAQDVDAPVRTFQIDFTRQNTRFEFEGFVKSFKPTAGGPSEPYTFDASIRVTGVVTKTSPIPG